MVRDFEVQTPDGRTIACQEGGDPGGSPIVIHHGTPSGRSLYEPHVAEAEREGIRLICFDRPGYGGSSPNPGRTVADVARDVAAIADAIGADRFATWGISGGGPHALACAALLPERVTAAASLASVAPFEAEGLDWYAGMGGENIEEFGLTVEGREALEPYIERAAEAMLSAPLGSSFAELETLISGPDAAALRTGLGIFLDTETRAAIGSSREGWVEDDLAFVRPWGFDLSDIRVPVLLWHGVYDLMVPPDHGRWLAGRIPDVDARTSADDGHLSLLTTRVAQAHAWLLDRGRGT